MSPNSDQENHPQVPLDESSNEYQSDFVPEPLTDDIGLLSHRSIYASKKGFFRLIGYQGNKKEFCLSLLTWNRIKILVVFVMLVLSVYLFTQEPEEEAELNIFGLDQESPRYITISGRKGFHSPLAILSTSMTGQRLSEENPNVTVFVALQKLDLQSNEFVNEKIRELTLSTEEELMQSKWWHINEKRETTPQGRKYPTWRFELTTDSDHPIAVKFEVLSLPSQTKYQVIFAALILAGVYVLIIFELIHRTIAAMLGAFVGLATLSALHARPTLAEVITWVDFDTTGLLFGMMIMVGIFSQTGFFEYSAIKAYKISKGDIWKLVMILSIFTAVVSAFLDNVTTILLLTPVTIKLCKILDLHPGQFLITLVMYSNIGGTATAVGDPPNIIIVNDSRVQATGKINFLNFSLHIVPGVILSCLTVYFLIKWLSRNAIVQKEPNLHKKNELKLWKKTLTKMEQDTEEEKKVVEQLEKYIISLEEDIKNNPFPAEINLPELEEKYGIKDWTLFLNSCLVLGVVIMLFFLHSVVHLELSLAWIAIIGAMAHLLISGIKEIEEIIEKVEWATLMFFAALFVLMRTLEELGLIDFIGETTAKIIEEVPAGDGRLTVAVILITWVSAIVSAFIDNIPYTAAMVPVVVRLGNGDLGLPLTPLIWALVYGTCFGGNGTLIGASANVVAAGISEAEGYPIRFNTFLKTGFPVMIASVFVSMCYNLVFHVAIPWY